MTDYVRPMDLALASGDLARAYANVAMRALVATAAQSFLLWSDFISASTPQSVQASWSAPMSLFDQAMRMQPFGWMAPPGFNFAAPTASIAETTALAALPVPFSNYRSAGGHAAAQVIIGS